ncbi:MAG TPA: autotransporter domain-containing protein [Xanthobacteraceae bacterium]|nr:autotransporter domain-containing protein [Xanthobacteraceae bacterium]
MTCTIGRSKVRGGIRAALLAGTALAALPAGAQDATWLASPPGSSFNSAANWNPASVPTGTAFFGASNTTAIDIGGATIGGLTFNPGASDYQFQNGGNLTFNGAGISVLGGSASIRTISLMSFRNTSTAGSANITAQSGVAFFDKSTAGSAHIDVQGVINQVVTLTFRDNSSATNATINNGFFTEFVGFSTAANATINNTGTLTFRGSGNAGNASINNNHLVNFENTSSAGNATILTDASQSPIASVNFRDQSSGGAARFILKNGGKLDISQLATTGTTAGSIEGDGRVELGTKKLVVGGNNLSTTFSGAISDSAFTPSGIVKSGFGTLTLTGANTYMGSTLVDGGTLLVNGSLASIVVAVSNGATLGGIGTLTDSTLGLVSIHGGGTLSPGNSIGVFTINGQLIFGAGSIYRVEVGAGTADRTNVGRDADLSGGTVRLVAGPGGFARNAVILSAAGGLNGTRFAGVTGTNFNASLSYTTTDVLLNLTSALGADTALNASQQNVAGAINTVFNAGGTLPPGFGGLFGLTGGALANALSGTSGEVHASTPGLLADESLYLRSAVLGRLRQASYGGDTGAMAALALGGPQSFADGEDINALAYAKSPIVTKAPTRARDASRDVVFWAQGFGAWGRFDGDSNAATVRRDLAGFITGIDTRVGDAGRAGIAAGYTGSKNALDGRGTANVETAHVAAYGGWSFGALNLRAGGAYAFHAIDTDRSIAFPGFFDRATAHYDGATSQIFGEAGYGFSLGAVALEPFAGAAWVRVNTDGAAERGGAAALNFAGGSFQTGYTTLGIRAAGMVPLGDMVLIPRGMLAWQHAFDDVIPAATLAFQAAPVPFAIAGVPLARDALLAEAGLDLAISRHATIGVSYTGQIAGNVQDHAAKGRFSWKF